MSIKQDNRERDEAHIKLVGYKQFLIDKEAHHNSILLGVPALLIVSFVVFAIYQYFQSMSSAVQSGIMIVISIIVLITLWNIGIKKIVTFLLQTLGVVIGLITAFVLFISMLDSLDKGEFSANFIRATLNVIFS